LSPSEFPFHWETEIRGNNNSNNDIFFILIDL
jgi:hypothetical protein